MSNHTPGPWEISRGYTNSGYPCFWINGMSGLEKHDVATLDANARLIAEAPDMFALLIELTDIEGPLPGNAEWARKVKAVIAKATQS